MSAFRDAAEDHPAGSCPHCGRALYPRPRRLHRFAEPVLATLSGLAGGQGSLGLSLDEIADATGLTRKQIRRALASLVDHGRIRLVHRFSPEGSQLPNVIELISQEPSAEIAATPRRPSPIEPRARRTIGGRR